MMEVEIAFEILCFFEVKCVLNQDGPMALTNVTKPYEEAVMLFAIVA
jgi:hypothetical protein